MLQREPSFTVGFLISERLLGRVDAAARKHNVSRSEYFRLACEEATRRSLEGLGDADTGGPGVADGEPA